MKEPQISALPEGTAVLRAYLPLFRVRNIRYKAVVVSCCMMSIGLDKELSSLAYRSLQHSPFCQRALLIYREALFGTAMIYQWRLEGNEPLALQGSR